MLEALKYRFSDTLDKIRLEREYRSKKELSDFPFLERIDGYLANQLGANRFKDLIQKFADADKTAYDIGAARNPIRGIVFFNARRIICIDPGYEWYEYRPATGQESTIPYDFFAGKGEKDEMIKIFKTGLKHIQLPRRIEGATPHVVRAMRKGQERIIELRPEDGSRWIKNQAPESLSNIILWRTFLPSKIWGEVIASLKVRGFLVTTGFGKIEGRGDYEKIACGGDIDNSPLPGNGNAQTLGLQPLTDLPEIYFYQKIKHLPQQEITMNIRKNL